jgi:phytol kinase
VLVGLSVVVTWLTLVFVSAVLIKKKWPQQQELSRKVVHIGAGFALPLAWCTEIPLFIALPAAAIASLLALINHRWRILASIEDVGRFSYGTVAYGASITILLALYWPERADLVCAAVLTMALADGLAGLLGANFSSHRWQIFGQTKSIIGTATMALVTLLVLTLLLPNLSWYAVIAIAITATILEQFSWAGLDNLTVPLLVGAMGTWLRG